MSDGEWVDWTPDINLADGWYVVRRNIYLQPLALRELRDGQWYCENGDPRTEPARVYLHRIPSDD